MLGDHHRERVRPALLGGAALVRGRMVDKAYVNDGGDIAVFAAPGETLAIGLAADPEHLAFDGAVTVTAASGIGGFRGILGHVESYSPLRRTVTIEDVGNVGAFLCSDLAAGVTGEVTYVDAGYNILGMTGIGED